MTSDSPQTSAHRPSEDSTPYWDYPDSPNQRPDLWDYPTDPAAYLPSCSTDTVEPEPPKRPSYLPKREGDGTISFYIRVCDHQGEVLELGSTDAHTVLARFWDSRSITSGQSVRQLRSFVERELVEPLIAHIRQDLDERVPAAPKLETSGEDDGIF